MADSRRAVDARPLFVINICSSEDNNGEHQQRATAHAANYNPLSRSLSTPDHARAYKDLTGAVHYYASTCHKSFVARRHSYPNDYALNDKSLRAQSPTMVINDGMALLDPYNGTQSPGGSSSRYSLYGSFFDLSENGYHPPVVKPDAKLLTIDGRPLLIVDKASKLSANTFQEKCNDWLTHLNPM